MKSIKICVIMAGVYILGAMANESYQPASPFTSGYFTGIVAVVLMSSITYDKK